MSSSTMELFVASYGTEQEAGAALKDFQAAQREPAAIDLIDAAVIVHTAEGKVKFEETADPSGKKWAKRGAIAGGVVGLIFPPSIIVSARSSAAAPGALGEDPRQGLQGRGPEGDRREPAARLVGHHRGRRGPDDRAAGARRSTATRRSPSMWSRPRPRPRSWPRSTTRAESFPGWKQSRLRAVPGVAGQPWSNREPEAPPHEGWASKYPRRSR